MVVPMAILLVAQVVYQVQKEEGHGACACRSAMGDGLPSCV